MISSEVQRTLVKSPPELWAELSDPAALARHLGELGEIRITRTEPEKTVEWAGESITGSVRIKPSGWGTRVTLSVTRERVGTETEADVPTEADTVAEDAVETMAIAESEVAAVIVPEPSESVAEQDAEGEPTAEAAPEPRRGFFARLFGRR